MAIKQKYFEPSELATQQQKGQLLSGATGNHLLHLLCTHSINIV